VASPSHPDRAWPLWPLLPIYPFGQRQTLREEVVPGQIWTFDQLQGILYVVTPIRMTVIKLRSGGLLVYAPVAPTPECVTLMEELIAQHGAVQHIILPTVSGLEHKVYVGPFARRFKTAQVWVAPHQWSFPLNLPLSWLGLPIGRTKRLSETDAPLQEEFSYAILGPIDLGLGPFEEVAMLHHDSGTLLVTDAVLAIPEEPPAIVSTAPQALLFHARDHASDRPQDTYANQIKGWQRIALFSFYFRPDRAQVTSFKTALKDAKAAGDRSRRGYFGLFPFQWQPDWETSFQALRRNGELIVAPILQVLILNRAPKETLEWADRIAQWSFQRVIPCHLQSPVETTPAAFRQAFVFLEGKPTLPEADFSLLRQIGGLLDRLGVTPKRPRD
jgi:hypothetical protein